MMMMMDRDGDNINVFEIAIIEQTLEKVPEENTDEPSALFISKYHAVADECDASVELNLLQKIPTFHFKKTNIKEHASNENDNNDDIHDTHSWIQVNNGSLTGIQDGGVLITGIVNDERWLVVSWLQSLQCIQLKPLVTKHLNYAKHNNNGFDLQKHSFGKTFSNCIIESIKLSSSSSSSSKNCESSLLVGTNNDILLIDLSQQQIVKRIEQTQRNHFQMPVGPFVSMGMLLNLDQGGTMDLLRLQEQHLEKVKISFQHINQISVSEFFYECLSIFVFMLPTPP